MPGSQSSVQGRLPRESVKVLCVLPFAEVLVFPANVQVSASVSLPRVDSNRKRVPPSFRSGVGKASV